METREWKTIKEYQDILFDFYNGIAKITINRPRYRNAFTPTTTSEISDALYYCRECQDINVVVLTGAGDKAFCSGGDMHVKGHGGYIGTDGVPHVLAVEVVRRADPVVVAGALVLAQQVPLDAAEDVHLALILGLELGNGGLVLGRAAGAHAVFTVALGIAMAREAQCGQPLRTRSGGPLL